MYSVQELHLCLFSFLAEVIPFLNSLHSHLNLLSFQRCSFLQTLLLGLHLHFHVSCHSVLLVPLVPDTRLNTLTFYFSTTSGTHSFVDGLLILLQLPLHLLVLILKGKNTGSSPLTLTIYGLTLHSWNIEIEIQLNGNAFSGAALNEFTLVKVDKNDNTIKRHLSKNPNILLYYVIFFH